jgi:DNA polymerase
VFGEGPRGARLFLIGEQPGDEEDKTGKPFVGPAGKLLNRALAAAHIERDDVYITNAVKHFGFVYRGKRRLHSKPIYRSVLACRPWLEAELSAVKPQVVLCLGATASQSLLGTSFSVMRNRGQVLQTPWAKSLVVSYHPSAILRMPDADARHAAFAAFVRDLELCVRQLK